MNAHWAGVERARKEKYGSKDEASGPTQRNAAMDDLLS